MKLQCESGTWPGLSSWDSHRTQDTHVPELKHDAQHRPADPWVLPDMAWTRKWIKKERKQHFPKEVHRCGSRGGREQEIREERPLGHRVPRRAQLRSHRGSLCRVLSPPGRDPGQQAAEPDPAGRKRTHHSLERETMDLGVPSPNSFLSFPERI